MFNISIFWKYCKKRWKHGKIRKYQTRTKSHVHATNLVVKIPKSYGMSEKFKEDIRRTIREELSKALSGNKDAADSSNSTETSQNTATSNSGTTSCQPRGGGGTSTLTFRDFYRIREATLRPRIVCKSVVL